jgi:hypothetical protein
MITSPSSSLTDGPVATVLKIEGGLPGLQVDNVAPFRSERDEQANASAGAKAG